MNNETQVIVDDLAESTELISVVQLPIITEQLHSVKAQIEAAVSEALSMECTEESLQAVKKKRAELRKSFEDLEQRRKMAKDQIMSPYNAFDAVYKECVTDVFIPGDKSLKAAIDSIEDGIKAEKSKKAEAYFNEYAASLSIDFLTWDMVGISVTKSVSQKKLQEQAKACLDRVREELDLISTQKYADEVLAEYKANGCNVSGAVVTIKKRHEAVERERQRREAIAQEQKRRAAEAAEKRAIMEAAANDNDPVPECATLGEPLAAPESVPIQEPERINEPAEEQEYMLTFKVWGTMPRLKDLKSFLVEGGYRFE